MEDGRTGASTNGLSAQFLDGYAERCRRLLTAEYPSDVAGELMWLISEREIRHLPASAYTMWAEFSDAWDVGGPAERSRADELMRRAAEEFLALDDPATELPAWSEGWLETLLSDETLWADRSSGSQDASEEEG